MITLIGFRCKRCKVLSREVLIDRVSGIRKKRLEYRNSLLFLEHKKHVKDLLDASILPAHLGFLLWWFGGGVTPVLIPNTEVKPACGDGTLGTTRGE
jgi:hypothetical protein